MSHLLLREFLSTLAVAATIVGSLMNNAVRAEGYTNASLVSAANRVVAPKMSATNCVKFSGKPDDVHRANEISTGNVFLDSLLVSDSVPAREVATLAPDSILWWLQRDEVPTIITMSTAIHETVHFVDGNLTACKGGNFAYYHKTGVQLTDLRTGETESVSIIQKTLPEATVPPQSLQRFKQYVLINSKNPSNQLQALLEEWGAHLAAADFELVAAKSNKQGSFPSGMRKFNGNIAGVADFMLLFAAYVKSARQSFPDTFRVVNSRKSVRVLVEIFLRDSERILEVALRENSLYIDIPVETLRLIYNGGYIDECSTFFQTRFERTLLDRFK